MSNKKIEYKTSIDIALDVIGGKWKVLILWNLVSGPKRTSELLRLIPNINQRMLIQQLREMERDEVVNRKLFPQVPPKVEYSLTQHGMTLIPVINALSKWGIKHVESTFPKKSIEYKTICAITDIKKNETRYMKRKKPIK